MKPGIIQRQDDHSGEIWGDPRQTWGDQGPSKIQANITTFDQLKSPV